MPDDPRTELGGRDDGGAAAAPFVSVAERIRHQLGGASAGERRIARSLLANYPAAGLETAAALAERAAVSTPTVVRYVARLGFGRYRDFQQALRAEIEARQASPLTLVNHQPGDGDSAHLRVSAGTMFRTKLDESFAALSDTEVDAVVDTLADATRRVACVGGRYSGILAEYLHLHLRLLRPGTQVLDTRPQTLATYVLDAGRKDVLVVFDYRRYQHDIVTFAGRARDRGARIILFTDPWMSPVGRLADLVLPTRVEAPSPFDSLVPALAVVEMIISAVTTRLGPTAESRLRSSESLNPLPDRETGG